MTKESRKLRHELHNAILKHGLSTRFKAIATNRQMRSTAKRIADVILSGKDPRFVYGLDGKLVRLQEVYL